MSEILQSEEDWGQKVRDSYLVRYRSGLQGHEMRLKMRLRIVVHRLYRRTTADSCCSENFLEEFRVPTSKPSVRISIRHGLVNGLVKEQS